MRTNPLGPSNILLDRLPNAVRKRLQPELKPVSLALGKVLHKPGDKITALYFPTTCMISVTVAMRDGRTVEAGAIGNREVVGINALMGGREMTQTEYIVQLAGEAMKIDAEPLKTEFNRNTEMRDVMLRYTQTFLAQISQNVACNRLHAISQRFTRWLLEVRDRVQSDHFSLTQTFMSQMLGIRRSGVTEVAAKLKRQGVIDYRRGNIQIKQPESLEKLSCECYFALKEEYDRLLA